MWSYHCCLAVKLFNNQKKENKLAFRMILRWQECLLNYVKHPRQPLSGKKRQNSISNKSKDLVVRVPGSDFSSDICELCCLNFFIYKIGITLHKQPCEVNQISAFHTWLVTRITWETYKKLIFRAPFHTFRGVVHEFVFFN